MFSLFKKADYKTAASIKKALNIATRQVETRRITRKITIKRHGHQQRKTRKLIE